MNLPVSSTPGLLSPAPFDLAQTLDCGQAFRWIQLPSQEGLSLWEGVAFGSVLRLAQQGRQVWFFCTRDQFDTLWRPYFDLDQDYETKRQALSDMSPALREAAAFAPGIRILRQDPWEALCSFIISQNNHIPRIKGIIARLCQLLGDPISGETNMSAPAGLPWEISGENTSLLHPRDITAQAPEAHPAGPVTAGSQPWVPGKNSPPLHPRDMTAQALGLGYAFPRAEALAACSLEDLAPLRAGFRAKYLLDAARKVVSGQVDLDRIARSPAEWGRQELQKIFGVGPKVAECVLLYGFHKTECFPMDVWMKRAMATLLPGRNPQEFGENAGLAQQYLFHYSRLHPELFSSASPRKKSN